VLHLAPRVDFEAVEEGDGGDSSLRCVSSLHRVTIPSQLPLEEHLRKKLLRCLRRVSSRCQPDLDVRVVQGEEDFGDVSEERDLLVVAVVDLVDVAPSTFQRRVDVRVNPSIPEGVIEVENDDFGKRTFEGNRLHGGNERGAAGECQGRVEETASSKKARDWGARVGEVVR
jgi:hypothetical protein